MVRQTRQKRAVAILFWAAAALPGQNVRPPEEQRMLRAIYKEMVEHNTSYTTGQTTAAAEAIAKRLRDAGFPASDIQVDGAAEHKKNVVVRYRGTGAGKPILLLAHLDVVEAKRTDWEHDPFVLREEGGYFYGRGTGDDKAQASIWLANLIQFRKEGWKPGRDLIAAWTADEEGWGKYNGVSWLLKHHRDWIDAEYCINEGGWGEMSQGRKLMNQVQVSEKTFATFRLEVRNPGGHSSVPVKENAIYRLAQAIEKVSQMEFPPKLNDVTRGYFESMSNLYDGALRADLLSVSRGDAAAIARIAGHSATWNAMLRTTCVATMLDGGHAENALPQSAGVIVNCRVLPNEPVAAVEQALRRAIADEQVRVGFYREEPAQGPASPMREDVMQAARSVTSSMWQGVPVVPIMVMGGTDGMFLRNAGIPTYGIMGLFLDRDDLRFHGLNERIGVKEFYEAQEFLYRLVKQLAR
ncbi:MAG: M20/M25/M40 family metallo-hydrolase [Bryobacterales bacterium]|nr:M20/M25/M40 family metallo-hydrolase [Bryobacterales bacterium]